MDRHHLLRASSTLVGALALTSVLGGTALAETPSPGEHEPTNTVTFSPLPLALNREIDLEYEHALNDDVSLFAGPSFIVGSTSACSCSFSAYGGTFGARLFAGRAPSGVFVGIFGTALYASASVNGSSASVSGLAYEAGGMLGYTFIVAGHVDLSLGVGAAYANEQLTLTAPSSLRAQPRNSPAGTVGRPGTSNRRRSCEPWDGTCSPCSGSSRSWAGSGR